MPGREVMEGCREWEEVEGVGVMVPGVCCLDLCRDPTRDVGDDSFLRSATSPSLLLRLPNMAVAVVDSLSLGRGV